MKMQPVQKMHKFKKKVGERSEELYLIMLYFVTKNHSFSDGNKRIAATVFLYFLDKTVFFMMKMVIKE